MPTYVVSPDESSFGGVLGDGDVEQVYGTASDMRVHRGGLEEVFAGGTASGTVVSSGGLERVLPSGTAVDTVVRRGGRWWTTLPWRSRAVAPPARRAPSRAAARSWSAGPARRSCSRTGATATAAAPASTPACSSSGRRERRARGRLPSSAARRGRKILPGDAPANTISGVLPGTTIDLAGIGLAYAAALGAGNVLTVSAAPVRGGHNGAPVALHLDPNQSYAGYAFHLGADGHGGTAVTVVPAAPSTVPST